MRRTVLLLVVVVVAAAALAFLPLGPGDPSTHRVVRGDTLGRIAADSGVLVDDLRRWNHVEGDLIRPGDDLLVEAPGAGRRPLWRLVAGRLAGVREGAIDDGDLAGAPADGAGQPAADRTRRAAARRVRAPARGGARPDGAGEVQPDPDGGHELDDPTPRSPLRPPDAKPCLDSFSDLAGPGGEPSFGRSAGLSADQVRAGVDRFTPETLRCYDDHPTADGEVVLELAIGCDGRVRRADVLEDATGEAGFARCVAEVFTFASFAAHARDEVVVQVPLWFEAP